MDCEDDSFENDLEEREILRNLRLDGNLPPQEDSGASGMTINAEDLTQEEAMKLRGDRIGDTTYSQKYVLKLLLQLQDLRWDSEVEQDFVNLWDMTEEKEVCSFLLGFNFPNLVTQTVLTYHDNYRLIEILMGILSNIAFVCKEAMVVSPDDMKIFVSLFYCENGGVLTQVVNFFGHVWSENVLMSLVDSEFLKQVLFILVNCLNCELLYEILSFLTIMCVDATISESLLREDPHFLKYCVDAYEQVYRGECRKGFSTLFTVRQYSCLYNLMCVVTHVSTLTPNDELKAALYVAEEPLREESTRLLQFISGHLENLESLHEPDMIFKGLLFFLYALDEPHIVSTYHPELFKILLILAITSTENELSLNYLFELVLYLICLADDYGLLISQCSRFTKHRALNFLKQFAHVTNEWRFGNTIVCTQNLHSLLNDMK